MAIAQADAPRELTGVAQPRVAPPAPAKSLVKDMAAAAKAAGHSLLPWQLTAGSFLTAHRAATAGATARSPSWWPARTARPSCSCRAS